MPFDATRFVEDHTIEYARRGKHARKGWVNISCPFCTGHPGYHGGFNLAKSYYNCHRCGNHWIPAVIRELLHIPLSMAIALEKQYWIGSPLEDLRQITIQHPDELQWPVGTGPLKSYHKKYLHSRGFDIRELENVWNVHGIDHRGDRLRFRILVPIYFNNQPISYTARDIYDKTDLKYISCDLETEVYPHKYTLYGYDIAAPMKKCIVVEGAFDAWKMGPGAVSTFGIEWTWQQAHLLAKTFDKIVILYDTEEQACRQASDLEYEITLYNPNIDVQVQQLFYSVAKDPGELKLKTARQLATEFLG